jgi:capsular polysaccharide biosynthesis protein
MSTTQLYVLNRADDSTTTLTDLQTSTQLTKDYIILVQSRPVLEYVISDLDLNKSVKELSEAISVTTIADSRILQISVKDADPYMAKEIADSMANFAATQIC